MGSRVHRAPVLYIDSVHCYIDCPWCQRIHRHYIPTTKFPSTTRVPHCLDNDGLPDYDLDFPNSWKLVRSETPKRTILYLASPYCKREDLPESLHDPPDFQDKAEDFGLSKLSLKDDNQSQSDPEDKKCLSLEEDPILALRIFALQDRTEEIIPLIKSGVHPDSSRDDKTALHIATMNDSRYLVLFLLKCGANINKKTNDGLTPLHLACMYGHSKMVDILLVHGANVDVRLSWFPTPLMEAARYGRLDIVQTLLRVGADINLKAFIEHPDERRENRVVTAYDFAKDDYLWSPVYSENTERCRQAMMSKRRAIMACLSPHDIRDQVPSIKFVRGPKNQIDITENISMGQTDRSNSKTVAFLDRGPDYPYVAAISGYEDGGYTKNMQTKFTVIISNKKWTDIVLDFVSEFNGHMEDAIIDLQPHHLKDKGKRGRYHACHAEKQLVAYYIYEQFILPWDDHWSVEKCREECPPLEGDKSFLERIRESPSDIQRLTPECKITVTKPPCDNCKAFLKTVGDYLSLTIDIIVHQPV
jgi:ankyrin repeat protein